MQKLSPIENEIFDKANGLIEKLDKKYSGKDILKYYAWFDNFLDKSYKEQFSVYLLSN